MVELQINLYIFGFLLNIYFIYGFRYDICHFHKSVNRNRMIIPDYIKEGKGMFLSDSFGFIFILSSLQLF